MSASVSVVTVTYNSSSVLDDFLASLEKSSVACESVIVVDNHSDDLDSTRAIVERHSLAALIELGENRGYGSAMNVGARLIGEEYILISNPDVRLSPPSIQTLIDAAETDQTGAAFGPRILDAHGAVYPSARTLPTLAVGIGHALFARAWPSNPWTHRYLAVDPDASEPKAVGWLSGSCLLVRRSAFEQIGGFDEGYFMYFEDVDLGARLGDAGWKNVYVPSATVTHSGAHSTSSNVKAMSTAHHDSAYQYISKRYSAPYLAPVRLALRSGLTLRRWWLRQLG